MARAHERIDQRLVVRVDVRAERARRNRATARACAAGDHRSSRSRLAHTQASANCGGVRPLLRRVRLAAVCAIASDSSRNSVSMDALVACARAREPSGGVAPGAYLPVSTPRASGRVGHDADAVVIAGRQDLDLRHAVQQRCSRAGRRRAAARPARRTRARPRRCASRGNSTRRSSGSCRRASGRRWRASSRRAACRDRPCAGNRCRCSRCARRARLSSHALHDPAPRQCRRRAAPWRHHVADLGREDPARAVAPRSPAPTIASDAPLA